MNYKAFSFGLLGIVAGAFLTGALQFVVAWNAPTATAPGGNVSAPINVSGVSQTKAGGLRVASLISDGGIKVGITSASCDASLGGTLRYNTTSKCVEFCDETTWKCTNQTATLPPPPPPDKNLTCKNLGYDIYNSITDQCEYVFKVSIAGVSLETALTGYQTQTIHPNAIATYEGCGMYCGYSSAEGGYNVYGNVDSSGKVTIEVGHSCRYPSKCGGGTYFKKTATVGNFKSSSSGDFYGIYGGGGHTWKYENSCLSVLRAGVVVRTACFLR